MDAEAVARPNIKFDGGKPSLRPCPAEGMYVPAVDAELSGETRYSSSFGRWNMSVRSALNAAKSGFGAPKLRGDSMEDCPVDLLPNGVRSTLVVSKSSGSARDLSILSRSFVVRRFNFARLPEVYGQRKNYIEVTVRRIPILKPHLHLAWRQAGNLP